MERKRMFAFGQSGIIVLLCTIIILALTGKADSNTSALLGKIFLLYSEIILFSGLIGIEYAAGKGSQIITRAGCGVILTAYSAIVFLSSIIYIFMNTNDYAGFLIFELVLLTLAAIFSLVFYMIAKSEKERSTNVLYAVATISNLADRLKLLTTNKKYGRQLEKLAEDLQFSDTSSIVESDTKIEALITKIETALSEDNYAEDVSEYINSIADLIKKRKIQIRNVKMGGI